jgi:hypothetical protein
VGILFFVFAKPLTEPTTLEPASSGQEPGNQICVQVITPARNPLTGEIKEYPTPCDVPPTWEVIVDETPGLDDYQPQ